MKMNTFVMSSVVVAGIACGQTTAATLKQAYLDEMQNVHVITSRGRDLKITSAGQGTDVQLSPNGDTVAWLVKQTSIANDVAEAGSNELAIYHGGRVRSIKCGPFIREYWFWMKGSRIAIDCGGSHFAGREILYDVKTLKEIASFDQASVPVEKRPSWSSSSEQFDDSQNK